MMKSFCLAFAVLFLMTGCSLFREHGEYYPGYTCEKSLTHFYSYCIKTKFSKEEFETAVKSCETEFVTKICDREQADLLWCLGRVTPGVYSRQGGIVVEGFYLGKQSVSDGCDRSTYSGALKACRMKQGIF